MTTPAEDKARLREELAKKWGLEAPLRPPAFGGVGKAAERLRRQPEYRRAGVIAVMPDPVLEQVRINALNDGKTLLAATPGLKQGLYRLTPHMVPMVERGRGLAGHAMARYGQQIRLPHAKMPRVELLVGPALAVDREGRVLGDGRGLLDLMAALLVRLKSLGEVAQVAVLADDTQIMDTPLPQEPHDQAAHMVITPTGLTRHDNPQPKAPSGELPRPLAGLPVVKAALNR